MQTSYALFQLERKEDAAARVEEFLKQYPKDSGGNLTAMQALLAASAGDRALAEQKIAHAIQIGEGYQHFHHTAYILGSAYALMNEHERALRFLRQAAEEGVPLLPIVRERSHPEQPALRPAFRPVHGRPEEAVGVLWLDFIRAN